MQDKVENIFRQQYRELSSKEKLTIDTIKDQANILYLAIEQSIFIGENSAAKGRAVALAKTKLEEAVMWAVKGITS